MQHQVLPDTTTPGTTVVQLDGFWDVQGKAGTGVLFYDQTGRLMLTHYQSCRASTPIHAEVLALLEALQYACNGHTSTHFTLCSDCQVLVRAVAQKSIADLPSWEAADSGTVHNIIVR